jgi:hypothetical protein
LIVVPPGTILPPLIIEFIIAPRLGIVTGIFPMVVMYVSGCLEAARTHNEELS